MTHNVRSNSPLSSAGTQKDNGNLSVAFDRCIQISIAVTTLVTATFITLASLDYFRLSSALLASVTGAGDLILSGILAGKKCVPEEQSLSPIPLNEPIIITPIKTPIIRPPNPLTVEKWDQTLKSPRDNCDRYNLEDPSKPIAFNILDEKSRSLPYFGNYEKNYGDRSYPILRVRLPPSQLPAFPVDIQKAFQADPNIELYFLILNDTDALDTKRNLVLHDMVMPEYFSYKEGQEISADLQRFPGGGLMCSLEAGIFAAQGIEKSTNQEHELDNSFKKFRFIVHPDKSGTNALSPNTCYFHVDKKSPACSFFLASRFRGRSIALYTILIKDNNSAEGTLVNKAASQENLSSTLEVLQDETSPYREIVKKLFAYYP